MFIDRIAVPTWDEDRWPFTVPAVRHVAQNGLEFVKPFTFLVGENGSGKSTLIEAMAERFGIDNRGGHGGRKYTPTSTERPSVLAEAMRMWPIIGNRKRIKSFFLRAEMAKGVFEWMTDPDHEGTGNRDTPVPGYGDRLAAELSHGESFLQVLGGRFTEPGLYLLDEPETPFSFRSCLHLIAVLCDLRATGSQIICATHSPLLTAIPDVQILELSERGIEEKAWKDLDVTHGWHDFINSPEAFMRHLLE